MSMRRRRLLQYLKNVVVLPKNKGKVLLVAVILESK